MAQQHSMYLEWGWLLARGINEERKEKEYSHTAKQGKQDHFYVKTCDIRIFKCLMWKKQHRLRISMYFHYIYPLVN